MINKLAVLLGLISFMVLFGGGIQFAYADGFDWRRTLGYQCRAVEAAIFEVSVSVAVVFDACLFRPSLLFLFDDLCPW